MDGYSISTYDIRSLGNAIRTAADLVGDQADRVRASEVTSADLGDGIGASYVEAVHGPLAESLTAFQSAGEHLVEQLAATFEHYERMDEAGAAEFNRMLGEGR